MNQRFHFMKTAFLKLPFHFSEEKLLQDLEVCKKYNFTSHFNKSDYSGDWTSISLRSQNGEMSNIFALPQNNEKYKDTELLQECTYFRMIIDFRIHIPITTNKGVHFFINYEEVKMLPSECWYGNFNFTHSVRNDGKIDRIHLVMDCLRNDWSDKLFAENGYNFEAEYQQSEYSRETKLQMIEQLKLMDTETSKAMIAQLEREL